MTLGTTWRICIKFTSPVQIEVFGQAYRFLRMFTSHFMLLWKEVSWITHAFLPVKFDWNNTSTQRKRSAPKLMMFPSKSSWVFSPCHCPRSI